MLTILLRFWLKNVVSGHVVSKYEPTLELNERMKKLTMRIITEIIIHCSATPEGKDFHASDIDRWHKAQGWHTKVHTHGCAEILYA